MKKVFIADDGTHFDTAHECVTYEKQQHVREKVMDFIDSKMLGVLLTHEQVADFIVANFSHISEIMIQTASDWISNEDNGTSNSPIPGDTLIQVKYRNGDLEMGAAKSWTASWKSTDWHFSDIVEYRILSDGEWVPNENNSNDFAPIKGSTLIEVKYRNGFKETGKASEWSASWCSIDGAHNDIVAYRILKSHD